MLRPPTPRRSAVARGRQSATPSSDTAPCSPRHDRAVDRLPAGRRRRAARRRMSRRLPAAASSITPFAPQRVDSTWVKDETGNVQCGSHKGRHLMGIGDLARRRARIDCSIAELAIASCGNARRSPPRSSQRVEPPAARVTMPTWADDSGGARSREARRHRSSVPRQDDDPPGDPCVLRLREGGSRGRDAVLLPRSRQRPHHRRRQHARLRSSADRTTFALDRPRRAGRGSALRVERVAKGWPARSRLGAIDTDARRIHVVQAAVHSPMVPGVGSTGSPDAPPSPTRLMWPWEPPGHERRDRHPRRRGPTTGPRSSGALRAHRWHAAVTVTEDELRAANERARRRPASRSARQVTARARRSRGAAARGRHQPATTPQPYCSPDDRAADPVRRLVVRRRSALARGTPLGVRLPHAPRARASTTPAAAPRRSSRCRTGHRASGGLPDGRLARRVDDRPQADAARFEAVSCARRPRRHRDRRLQRHGRRHARPRLRGQLRLRLRRRRAARRPRRSRSSSPDGAVTAAADDLSVSERHRASRPDRLDARSCGETIGSAAHRVRRRFRRHALEPPGRGPSSAT